jgi:hypothetical protein
MPTGSCSRSPTPTARRPCGTCGSPPHLRRRHRTTARRRHHEDRRALHGHHARRPRPREVNALMHVRSAKAGGGDTTEAEARGWRLEKLGKVFRVVDENGTVVAGNCPTPTGSTGSAWPTSARRASRDVAPGRLRRCPPRRRHAPHRPARHDGRGLGRFLGVPDHVWWNIRRQIWRGNVTQQVGGR